MGLSLSVLIIADFSAPSPGAFIQSMAALGKRVANEGGRIAFLFPTGHDYHSLLKTYGPIFVCKEWAGGKRFSLPLVKYARRICRAQRVNILHTHFGLATALCGCALEIFADVKHVWHWRSNPRSLIKNMHTPWWRCATPLFYRVLDALGTSKHVAISQDIAINLISRGFIHRDKIAVIHNSIDLSKFVTSSNATSKLESRIGYKLEGRPIIGMVANFGPYKDHETIIKAFEKVKRKIPEVLLMLVGDLMVDQGPERLERLRSNVRRLGLDSNVVFTGQWHPVSEIIFCFDVGILSSHWEGFGNVVVEYMAMNKPVVATRVGGIPEIVIDGETGFLVEPHNPFEMANRVIDLLADPQLRERMGDKGRLRAEEHFSIDRWTEEVFQVYRHVCGS